MSEVKIEKISLEINGKIIELTIEQARELRDVLKDTLGDGNAPSVYPVYIHPYTYTKHWQEWRPYYSSGTVTISSKTNI